MGAEHCKTPISNDTPSRLSVPPGFTSLSSFFLKKVKHCDENSCSKDLKDAEKLEVETNSDMIDFEKMKESIGDRPWIVYDKDDQIEEEYQPIVQPDKATAMQYPGDAREVLEEPPVFCPTEEEFSDSLKYIESIRLKAEPFGICRIIPPPSWQPPCLIEEKSMWECSTFSTQIQQYDNFPAQYVKSKTAEVSKGTRNRRSSRVTSQQGVSSGYSINPEEVACLDMECHMKKSGPEFTLKAFKKYADDFLQNYVLSEHKDVNNRVNCKQGKPSVESIEGKYRQNVEKTSGVLEVLYGDNLDTITFGSGFPRASNPQELDNYPSYVHSSWNLNNVPRLPGSLLSFESDKTSGVSVPQLRVGMCFSSLYWKVEEHHLYSLCYMHMGSPKVWHCIPGRYVSKFEALMKKYQSNNLLLHQGAIRGQGIPVYCCIQKPGEFVLVFPGAYHSAFDYGFNVVEAVNIAPLDWLPHGLNALALYQAQGRKMSISFDKLLIGAAREAVKAQLELSFLNKNTSDNLRWKVACGKNGILTETLKIRVKQEGNRREYLCTPSGKWKDKNFNATGKRECSICYCDLYLSAACCPCSAEADRYSCLNHAKHLCSSCIWSEKIFLYQYEISELNVLVQAMEGKLSSVHRWAKEDLNLSLCDYTSQGKSCTKDKGQKEHTFQDAATSHGNGWTTNSSFKEEVKAHLQQSPYLNKQNSKEKTISTPSLPQVTLEDTLMLLREIRPDSFSSSTSVSSSSDSEETADLGLNDGGKGHIFSTSNSRSPSHSEREETTSVLRRHREREDSLSELLNNTSGKHFKSTSEEVLSHPAAKKQKKKLI